MGAVACGGKKRKSKSKSNSNLSAQFTHNSSQSSQVPLQTQTPVAQPYYQQQQQLQYYPQSQYVQVPPYQQPVINQQPPQMYQQPVQQINQAPYPQNLYGQQNPNAHNPPYLQNNFNQDYGNQNYQQYVQMQQNNPQVNPRQSIDVDLSQTNDFIIEYVRNLIQSKQLQLSLNVNVTINGKIATIEGPYSEVQKANNDIQAQLQYLMTQYVKQYVNLNRKEVETFSQMTQEKQLIETNEVCKITINQSSQPNQSNLSNLSKQSNVNIQEQLVLQLTSQNKTFKIHQEDIQKLRSEAVVNSCNQQLEFQMQGGVAKQKIQSTKKNYYNTKTNFMLNVQDFI